MSQDDNTIEEIVEEVKEQVLDLEALKAKAALLGVSFSGNIGAKKLKEKIDLHLTELASPKPVNEVSMGPNDKIRAIEQKARKLVTVIITDNDPEEQSNPTIVHTVQNSYFKIGVIIRKDVEQDVPNAVVRALKRKTMVKWVPAINAITKRPTGNKTPITRNRYNIQYV